MLMKHRWLLLLCAAFLLVNAATLSRYPAVWVDEIQFADPAMNLASGSGFTSTAWFAQDSTGFFAGNTPLYPLVLAGWLRLLGVSQYTERLLNLVLFVAFALLVRFILKRTGLVASEGWRLAVVALLMTGHSMAFSYRSGRYDVLGMLLFALAVLAWSERNHLALFLAAASFPWAGLQLLPAAAVVCALALVFERSRVIARVALVFSGIAAGVIGLWSFYRMAGVWTSFRASTAAIGKIGFSLADKLHSLPGVYLLDKSRLFLMLLAVALLFMVRNRLLAFGLAAALLLPAALQMAGKFPIYYGWMAYTPLLAGVASACAGKKFPPAFRGAIVVVLCAAGMVGLPLRLAVVGQAWQQRDPERLQQFVAANVGSNTAVVADFKAWYALRSLGDRTFAITYLNAMRPEEKRAVTVMLLRPETVAAAREAVGGQWRDTGVVFPGGIPGGRLQSFVREMKEEDYPLVVLRRIS